MKNLINYYYGLLVNDFKKSNDHFTFEISNKKYEFIPFYGDLNKLYKIYLNLINNNKYCHEIILNKDKQLSTFYENKPYILLKKNICLEAKVDIREIINYDVLIYGMNEFNWKKLWEDKKEKESFQQISKIWKY